MSGKTNMLRRLTEAVLDDPDGIVSEVLLSIVNEGTNPLRKPVYKRTMSLMCALSAVAQS